MDLLEESRKTPTDADDLPIDLNEAITRRVEYVNHDREKKGISIRLIAQEVGVTISHVRKCLSFKELPSIDLLLKIEKVVINYGERRMKHKDDYEAVE